jgi:hypothetical protein
MSKRMTIVFDDEDLYNELKQEAARRGRPTKDIVAEAVQEWLEARDDEELQADLGQARTEWQRLGGVEAGEFFQQLESNPTD